MTSPPLVSVVMTAYNRESYIGGAIESVLDQQFRDFELLIVDDCSTDGTVSVAQEYAARDRRVRVILNERNLGDYANRNEGARAARGELLKFHDSDDLMYPHCLEIMVRLLQAHPTAGCALTGRCAWAGGPVPMELSPQLAYTREFLGAGAFSGGPATALFRRRAFEAIGGFHQGGAESDYATWLHFAATYPILLVPADLFWYRTHAQQELHSARAQRDYARVHGHAWRALLSASCPLEGADLNRARRNTVERLLVHLSRDVRRGRWALARYRWQQSGLTMRDLARYARRPVRTADAGTPSGPVARASDAWRRTPPGEA